MRIEKKLTDNAVLKELGKRLLTKRLDINLTQAELAEHAGVSKRTVERMETGKSTQVTNLVRILRTLDLLDGLNTAIPESVIRPMDLIKLKGKTRQRASHHKQEGGPGKKWQWGDEK